MRRKHPLPGIEDAVSLREPKCQAESRVFNLNTNEGGGGKAMDGKRAVLRKAFDIVA